MDPEDIFGLIVRADERLKYATDETRDLRKRQARELLVRALDAARASGNDALAEQGERRLSDLAMPLIVDGAPTLEPADGSAADPHPEPCPEGPRGVPRRRSRSSRSGGG